MRPELRTEVLRILEELSKGKEKGVTLHIGDQPLLIEAVLLLRDHGALAETKECTTIESP